MLKEFREFAIKGNAVDLAVGIIIGAAFTTVINSLVNDVIMPIPGALLGKIDFSNLLISLNGQSYPSLAAAKAAGAPTINYGFFLNNVISFLIVAFVVFLLVRAINRLRRDPAPTASEKDCPYCHTKIPLAAVRCPNCTSDLTNVPSPSTI